MKFSMMEGEVELNKIQSKWQNLILDKLAEEPMARQYNEEDAKGYFDWYDQNQPEF